MALFDLVKSGWSYVKDIGSSQAAVIIGGAQYGRSVQGNNTLSFQDAVKRGYKGIVWVNACIHAKAKAIGSVPWRVYKVQSDGTQVHQRNHELENLIENPTPFHTRRELMESLVAYLSLSGNSYWEIVWVGPKNAQKPKQLFPLRPDWTDPVPSKLNYLDGYNFRPNGTQTGKPIPFDPHEIMHFKLIDPVNEYVGMSPLQAAARTIATEDAAIRWNKALFDNSAVPSGILKIPSVGIKRQDRDKIREELMREFSHENLHRPMVLWGGMEWSKMAMDMKDLDFLAQRHMNKYEICSILSTPPVIVGANEDPTYANYDVARTAWWEDDIIPTLDWLQVKFNTQLASAYGDNIVLRYDISDVPAMRKSFREKVDTAKTLWMMGYPVNEINQRLKLGFPKLAWGDVWWAQINMMPVSDDNPPNPLALDPTAEGSGKDPVTQDPIVDPASQN